MKTADHFLQGKDIKIYLFLIAVVICGLTASIITAPKISQVGSIQFPFSNLVFSLLTYPIVDCICELWGKKAARLAMWLGLFCQLLVTLIIQLSIDMPPSPLWSLQTAYQAVLGTGLSVVIASLIAFSCSQLVDVVIYQWIKEKSAGRFLWLRSNISTYLGQILDSVIFIHIVFFDLPEKFKVIMGSVLVKIALSAAMTPVVYLIVIGIHAYLNHQTLAFKGEEP